MPGIWEAQNEHVLPRSLYYSQLFDRLGADALHNTMLPQQINGQIWKMLKQWDGEGLFLDPLVSFVKEITSESPGFHARITCNVRDLSIFDEGAFTSVWRKKAGPGHVSFENRRSLQTKISFQLPGIYELEITISTGTTTRLSSLTISAA